MTHWDTIYKNYQKGGEAWATLSEDIDKRFIEMIQTSNFRLKHALDIGCGTGKYLHYLKDLGFKVDGIDNSPEAIKMSREVLGKEANLSCTDMFEWNFPQQTYDLIISVSTLHHGYKNEIENLVGKIYEALVPGGKIFITVPDFDCAKEWDTFKEHTKLAPGTFAPLSGPEEGLSHSFFTKKQVTKLFSKFSELHLDLDEIGRWFVQAKKINFT